MRFKAILRRIGNSRGVIIPREVITNVRLGEELELEFITKQRDLAEVINKLQKEHEAIQSKTI